MDDLQHSESYIVETRSLDLFWDIFIPHISTERSLHRMLGFAEAAR